MTTKFNSFTVVLENDIREDDAEALLSAISQLRGVISVSGNVSDPSLYVAQSRARYELERKLLAVLKPE